MLETAILRYMTDYGIMVSDGSIYYRRLKSLRYDELDVLSG